MVGLVVVQTMAPRPIRAASIRALTFTEVVQNASVILRGRVVGTRSFRNVQGGPAQAALKDSRSPQAAAAAAAAAGAAQAPVALPAEGTGRMIFTQIDVEVGSYVKGGGGSIVTLTIPGGEVDGVRAWVPDLPTFTQGENVLLFLRDGWERAGDPAVGVNQGVFRVVADPATGGEIVLNAEQQIVIGVESDRVITRRNPRATTASSQLLPGTAGPPTPAAPGTLATASAGAARFLTSTEPGLTVSAFLTAVTARLPR
jgi:hypothetical protein